MFKKVIYYNSKLKILANKNFERGFIMFAIGSDYPNIVPQYTILGDVKSKKFIKAFKRSEPSAVSLLLCEKHMRSGCH